MKGISKTTLRFLIILMIVIPFIYSDSNSASAAPTATLIVEKQTDPDTDPQSFTFTGNVAGSISDGQQLTLSNQEPGTYTSTESAQAGWDLTSISCDDDNSTVDVTARTATFNIEEGETVKCTFTNTKRGTIIVEKQTLPDADPQNFTFTGDAAGSISDGGSIVVSDKEPGTYTSVETVPAGWDLTSISCDDINSTGNTSTKTATFQLDPGETVKCTFTNTKRGTIIVEKQTDPDADPQNFTFTGDAAGSISDGGSIVVSDKEPGTYTSVETVPMDWNLTSITCDDTNSSGNTGTKTATFQLDAGETVKCTFTNTKGDSTDPTIDIWYGSTQEFGQLGMPQEQIGILGNVSDNGTIYSLTYSLNGGLEIPLSIGPDDRRLDEQGDFVVEIFDGDLDVGSNSVEITATDTFSNTTTETVSVNYDRDNFWSFGTLDWNTASSIQDVAQVVDGKWDLLSDAVRTDQLGYDRMIAIGDVSWTDYEVTVPVTIHGTETPGPNSGYPAVGLLMHWTGHTDDPIVCLQPKCGWQPFGAITWYSWQTDPLGARLQIYSNLGTILDEDTGGKKLTTGETYIFKVLVEGNNYKLKVWEEGDTEPSVWDLDGTGGDLEYGSFMLFAHHVDATFGDVTVVDKSDPPAASTIVSDDFDFCSLGSTNLWTFVDPVGDASTSLTGTFTPNAALNISVPAGTDHDIVPNDNRAARIIQSANDTDFQVDAKFDSAVSGKYSIQGILVEEDADNFARIDFYSDGSNTLMYTASYSGTQELSHASTVLGAAGLTPLYMRVQREGARWIAWYSPDGSSWNPISSFPAGIKVTKIGVHAGNAMGATSPAHTGTIDYFYNYAAPGAGDGVTQPLTINTVGNGSVAKDPLSGYTCGSIVTLTATAGTGWGFSEWSGDLTGSTNPDTITIDEPEVVTGTFKLAYDLTVTTVGNGTVAVDPSAGPYVQDQQVTLTATGDPGWTFTGWSGDLSGSNNPAMLTITKDTSVTATFTQAEYNLTVNKVGNGTVVANPSQSTYHYGDQVTLIATGDPGWGFTGWSGDLSGFENPITLTITGNTSVMATFTEGFFTLQVHEVGNGTVEVSPAKTIYQHGDQVTLTATADTGWEFTGWSGSLSGSSNPATLIITADSTVTAIFTQEEYTLTVNKVGNGTVTVSPNKTTFLPGEMVTLTATPDPGWAFVEWQSGNQTFSDNPLKGPMTDDISITAVFTDGNSWVFLPIISNGD